MKKHVKIKFVVAVTFSCIALASCGDNSGSTTPGAGMPPVLLGNKVVTQAATQNSVLSILAYRNDYTIAVNGEDVTVTKKTFPHHVQKFNGIRLIKFIDKHTSLDTNGIPGQVYRLYQAAFNRKPDLTGLSFWITSMEAGHLTLETIAGQFLGSPESISLYGKEPSNEQLVAATYSNVLHRVPDSAGLDWWVSAMNNGLSRQSMLLSFSESPENKSNLLSSMTSGIDYAPYVAATPDTPPGYEITILTTIQSTNIGYLPGVHGRPTGTWHWSGTPARHIMVYVPQAINSIEQDYESKVRYAISQINIKLSGLIILEAGNSIPTSGNYIRISYDTAYVPDTSAHYSSFCANVSSAPRSGSPIEPDQANNITLNPVYINLGNGHCYVSQDIVTHEFGHALGLGEHFDGFGANGTSPISTLFWDVLATLYANPGSTLLDNLIVKYAK
jgi:hypothetical protein